MLRAQPIESFDDPCMAPYRTLRRQWDHQQQEIFVAEGEKVVRRLLESRLQVESILLPEKWLKDFEPLVRGRSEKVAVFTADKKLLEKLTGFSMYQGILAVGKIPPPVNLESILKEGARPYFLAAVDGLSNAENMGVLVRNCAAFGVQALIVGETCGTPYLRRAVRSSMGTVFNLPIVQAASLVQTLKDLRSRKIRCIAAHPHTNRKTIFETNFSTDCCVVFGSEGLGISEAVRNACDEAVAIPMHARVDSLNVGSAAAAFLYEVQRQRHTKLQ